MQCQLCKAYCGQPKEIEDNDFDEMRDHIREHQAQVNELNAESTRIFSNWCFPSLDLGIDEIVTDNSNTPCDVGHERVIGASFNGSILDYCRHLLNDYTDPQIECAICHIRILVIRLDSLSRRIDTAFSHVYLHLDENIFSCRRCNYKSKTPSAMRHHLRLHHALIFTPNYYKDRSEKYRDRVLAMLDQCYARNVGPKPAQLEDARHVAAVMPKGVHPMRTHLKPPKPIFGSKSIVSHVSTPITFHCLQLVRANSQNSRIQCRRCKMSMITGTNSATFLTRPAVDHVTRCHVKKYLYQCKQCSYASPAMHNMMAHIRNVHKISAMGNYVDLSQKYEQEIIGALSECFNGPTAGDGSAMEVMVKNEQKSPNQILPVQQHMTMNRTGISAFCLDILRTNARDGKIRCRLCAKDICVKNSSHPNHMNTPAAISHAERMHLRIQLFHCKRCPRTDKDRNEMIRHIRNKHQLPSTGQYVDYSEIYANQIMDAILECFGQRPSGQDRAMESHGPNSSAKNDDPNTYHFLHSRFTQVNAPLLWQCKLCAFATKHAKLIKNHVANHM